MQSTLTTMDTALSACPSDIGEEDYGIVTSRSDSFK